MRDTIDILGVKIDRITSAYALKKAEQMVRSDGVSTIFTPNPEIVMAAYEDAGFRGVLNSADMCTPDGIGVVYAAKMLGTPVPERVAGFDLVCGLLSNIRKTGEGVFLFGAKPGVAEAAAVKLLDEYVGLNIVGVHHGYFSDNETDDIVKQINESGAKLLLVCLGAPKQEKWMAAHQGIVDGFMVGVGAGFDYFAGNIERAPEWMQKCNLEWMYRLIQDPKRLFKRYLVTNTKFIWNAVVRGK